MRSLDSANYFFRTLSISFRPKISPHPAINLEEILFAFFLRFSNKENEAISLFVKGLCTVVFFNKVKMDILWWCFQRELIYVWKETSHILWIIVQREEEYLYFVCIPIVFVYKFVFVFVPLIIVSFALLNKETMISLRITMVSSPRRSVFADD